MTTESQPQQESDTATSYAEVAARLDRLPYCRVQRSICLKGGLSTTFDGMDNGIVSFILPAVTGIFALSGLEQGILGSSALIGAFVGALAVGVIGDRIGRRNLLVYSMVAYSAAMLLGGIAPDGVFLIMTRLVAGVAIGINSNIIMPYLAEFAPVRQRGTYVGSLAGFFGFGFVPAALIGYFLVPVNESGWRYAQLAVGVPILLAVWWRRTLPESPRYLLAHGRVTDAMREVERLESKVQRATKATLPEPVRQGHYAPEKHLSRQSFRAQFAALWQPPLLKQTVLVWVLWFCFSFSYYGFLVFLPTLLVDKGLTITESFGFSIIIEIAQVAGYFPAAALSERIDRKWSMIGFLIAGSLSALGLGLAGNNIEILAYGIALAFFLNGAYAPLYTYTPEVYPTWIRATGWAPQPLSVVSVRPSHPSSWAPRMNRSPLSVSLSHSAASSQSRSSARASSASRHGNEA